MVLSTLKQGEPCNRGVLFLGVLNYCLLTSLCCYFLHTFSCPISGSMIRPGKIAEFENVRSAIECRYLFDAIVDDELLKATQRQIKASLFEFVADNKTHTKENQRKELTTVSLPNSAINSAGDLTPFANLVVLDLTASLIPTWNIVADICKQLPRLEHLDLT